jgi:hypothetical protein
VRAKGKSPPSDSAPRGQHRKANVEQCDGLTLPEISQPTIAPEIVEDDLCERILTGWEDRPASFPYYLSSNTFVTSVAAIAVVVYPPPPVWRLPYVEQMCLRCVGPQWSMTMTRSWLLRTKYAVTSHSSQGQTAERMLIDPGAHRTGLRRSRQTAAWPMCQVRALSWTCRCTRTTRRRWDTGIRAKPRHLAPNRDTAGASGNAEDRTTSDKGTSRANRLERGLTNRPIRRRSSKYAMGVAQHCQYPRFLSLTPGFRGRLVLATDS